jgi:hypothetical protein
MKKKANTPQMWLTLLWHVGTGLPWAWKTGPSDSSERAHVQEMLGELPEKSLITADAGFVGYDFWKDILNSEHHFVARVGGNVSLLKNLGYARQHEHTVYLWPDCVAKKNQGRKEESGTTGFASDRDSRRSTAGVPGDRSDQVATE